MSDRLIEKARLAAVDDDQRAALLVLAWFADDDGRVRDGVVEAMCDGRLTATTMEYANGRRTLAIATGMGAHLVEIDLAPGAPMPQAFSGPLAAPVSGEVAS